NFSQNKEAQSYESPVQRPEIRNRQPKPQPNPDRQSQTGVISDQTMMNLERLRSASSDKDKTILERTVVYLENLQAKLPWWQKLLFGLLTMAIILGLAFGVFAWVWSLMTGSGEDEYPQD